MANDNICDMMSGKLDRSDPKDGETEVRPLTDDMTGRGATAEVAVGLPMWLQH